MILKRCLAGAVFLAVLAGLGVAWACNNSLQINGFEGAGSTCSNAGDLNAWQNPENVTITAQANGGFFVSPDPDDAGAVMWPSSICNSIASGTLTLPSSGFEDASAANWSSHQALFLAFASTDSNAANLKQYLELSDGTHNLSFEGVTITALGSITSASQWTYMAVSLGYAANMGLNLGSLASLSLQSDSYAGYCYTVYYDNLEFVDSNATPNNEVPAPSISVSQGCGSVTLSWPSQTQSGSDPIAGYHVYRSLTDGSPWSSIGYVVGTSFTDSTVPNAGAYYQVLPYSTSFSSYSNAVLTHVQADSAWTSTTGGPMEAALQATGKQAIPKATGAISAPTALTANACSTEIDLVWQAPPAPSGCNTIASYDIQRAPSTSPTSFTFLNSTTTASYADSPAAAGSWYYEVAAVDSLGTVGPYSSAIGPLSFTGSTCGFPTPVTGTGGTATPTPTPMVTVAVNSSKPAYVYPNPFYPDSSDWRYNKFHVGNVDPGATISIYNMVGALVLQKPESYFAANGGWDGNNNNGVKVVTGVYFLVVSGSNTVYNVAVIRGQAPPSQ